MTAVELVPGHVEGWRVWRATLDKRLLLVSMVYPAVWKPEQPAKALCVAGGETPCVVHQCGLHAFNSERQANEYAVRFLKSYPHTVYVVGRLAGAGRVVEHEQGWRAARAAVLSLDRVVTSRDVGQVGHDLLTQLRRRYRLALTLEVR